ncbi:type VI immunity family protein [Sorangium sp. So ce363]|uniref:type VI immunity family protein n=1 Tax=Sorangium sp. So ce363 TaxID=3133304 RepID=UPI003F62B07E
MRAAVCGAPWLGSSCRRAVELGFFRIAFPLLWFAGSSESFPEVMLEGCRKLKPVSGYGGIGAVESPDSSISSRYEPVVYDWAQKFPGSEADCPTSHSIWLRRGRSGGGIKGVNWLTQDPRTRPRTGAGRRRPARA